MAGFAQKAAESLKLIRKKKPLIHNITNLVTMNVTANALLAVGASPVMAHAPNEVGQMVSLSDALVLNLGTLSDDRVFSMMKAGKKASQLKIPVVLDPVGSGSTTFRTVSAKKLIEKIDIRVIRANPSEILSLVNRDSQTKGVDTCHSVEDAYVAAKTLAKELNITIAITGQADLVTDGNRVIRILNGHPLMGCITGSGCMATAIIAAFVSVGSDVTGAVASALAFFGLAGEIAGRGPVGPGTFMVKLLDALYTITPGKLEKGARYTGY